MRSILIYPEFGLRHIFFLVHGFNAMCNKDIEVVWSSRKLWPPDFGPNDDTDFVKYMHYEYALQRLADGGFDAVVLSDGSQVGYMSNFLRGKTTRVYLDSIDPQHLLGHCLKWCDIYLKCQYPNGPLMVGNSYQLEPYCSDTPVIPWPYCTSSWIDDSWLSTRPSPDRAVHFHGWCWPKSRVDAVTALIDAGIDVHGGFYSRDDCPVIQQVPMDLRAPRKPFKEFISDMLQCQIALNVNGNGSMCFRTHEILACGVCMVSEHLDTMFIGRPPINGEEWFVCDNHQQLIDCCKQLLEMPQKCKEVGAAGRRYWEQYCSPKVAATRLLQALGWC